MNTNESPFPPAPRIVEAVSNEMRDALASLHRYPDREAFELRTELSDYIRRQTGVAVGVDNIWPANGALDVLQQLMQVFGGRERRALGFAPTYSMYGIIAATTDAQWLELPRGKDLAFDVDEVIAAVLEHRPDLVFLTSPHNPTGDAIAIADLERIVAAAPGIVVVDEAYGEFSTVPSAIGLIDRFPDRVLVTRTMSKAFGFAGARLGYLVAAPAVVDAMKLVALPYHLSVLTQTAARVVLRHSDEILGRVSELVRERERVAQALRELGCTVFHSDANFLLFGRFADPARAWQRYLERGVLIRDMGMADFLRVTIGSAEENDRFIESTAALLAE